MGFGFDRYCVRVLLGLLAFRITLGVVGVFLFGSEFVVLMVLVGFGVWAGLCDCLFVNFEVVVFWGWYNTRILGVLILFVWFYGEVVL